MGLLTSLRSANVPRRRAAAFPGADLGRLTSTWTSDPGAINRWLRYELRTLRARSRALARGDAYGAKFIRACVDNIAGPRPFALQAKVRIGDRLNVSANTRIEAAYKTWSRPGNCEVTAKLSLAELDRLLVRCLARDGEILVRLVRGREYGALQLQVLDIDRLDEQRNEILANGNTIKMGVELNANSRPVAYHLLKQHPGESGEWNRVIARDYERVPADQVLHAFVPDWPEQVRGVPWMHAAMIRLWHLGGFEEAAVINARVGASKLAVLQSPDGTSPSAIASGTTSTGEGSAGNLLTDVEPGQYWTLPEGYELSKFDPAFPDASVGPFIQACLRGAAAAVGMAYHSLANDPGAVNYSTARVALLEERAGWSSLQGFYHDHVVYPRAREWMRGQVLMGEFAPVYLDYVEQLRFQPRSWDWVDPEKEINAKVTALDARLTSRTRIAAEAGEDFEDILDEIVAEEEMAEEKGVELVPQPPAAQAAPAPSEAAAETEDEAEPEEPEDEDEDEADAEDAADRAARSHDILRSALEAISRSVEQLRTVVEARGAAPEVRIDHHVHMPEQQVRIDNQVNVPEREVKVDVGGATVNVPEREVKVDIAGATVNVPEREVKVDVAGSTVNVSQPVVATEKTVERDVNGDITRVVVRPVDE